MQTYVQSQEKDFGGTDNIEIHIDV